jgi:hypothetical protein
MIVFTIVMIVDIFMFGKKMRTTYLPDAFGWQGKTVLVLIGILICAGWILVTWCNTDCSGLTQHCTGRANSARR